MSSEHGPQPITIRCDCCGEEIMAVERGGKLVILQERHGKKHFVSIPLTEFKKRVINNPIE